MKDLNNKSPYNKEKEPPKYRTSGFENGIPGINTPGVELPAYNPPVPNRAWTAMRKGKAMKDALEDLDDAEEIVSGINPNSDLDF